MPANLISAARDRYLLFEGRRYKLSPKGILYVEVQSKGPGRPVSWQKRRSDTAVAKRIISLFAESS